jgi:hypothetical protein
VLTDEDVGQRAEKISPHWRVQAGFVVAHLVNRRLQLILGDPCGKNLRFIGDEIVKARSNTRKLADVPRQLVRLR